MYTCACMPSFPSLLSIDEWAALTVRLGNTFKFVLLLDGVAVGASLGSVDELFSQAFSNTLGVTEGAFTSTSGDQSDGLVDTAQGRNVHGLTTDSTSVTNTSGIFTSTAVGNSVNNNLDGVGVGQQVDDFHGLLDDAVSQQLLAVVATVHHHGVGQAFNDGAFGLAETLGGETTSRVGQEDLATKFHVVLQGNVVALDTFVGPLAEQFDNSVI